MSSGRGAHARFVVTSRKRYLIRPFFLEKCKILALKFGSVYLEMWMLGMGAGGRPGPGAPPPHWLLSFDIRTSQATTKLTRKFLKN